MALLTQMISPNFSAFTVDGAKVQQNLTDRWRCWLVSSTHSKSLIEAGKEIPPIKTRIQVD
jgi:hypothetical protein